MPVKNKYFSLAKVCPSPPVLPHGRVILTSKRCSAGTTISYACVRGQGYYLFGPKSQTCVANANGDMIWTPKRPECITRLQFEQLCALQNKVMTFDPRPGCVLKSKDIHRFFLNVFCFNFMLHTVCGRKK